MNTTGMTVKMSLGRRDETPDFQVTGSTEHLRLIVHALNQGVTGRITQDRIRIEKDMKRLFDKVVGNNPQSAQPAVIKCREVNPGQVFKYADTNELLEQTQFIKLVSQFAGRNNVVNVATWMAAYVAEDADVVILGNL